MKRFPKVCSRTDKSGCTLLFINLPRPKEPGKPHSYDRIYLGVAGSAKAEERLQELKRKFAEGVPVSSPPKILSHSPAVSVALLARQFMDFVREDYSETSQEPAKIFSTLKTFVQYCGSDDVSGFTLRRLEDYRKTLLVSGRLCRKEINARIQRIKRLFRWGARRGLVPVTVHSEINLIENIRRGRLGSFDNPPVRPVPLQDVARTLPELTPTIRTMVRLQLLTGARPEEIRIMRPCDIDTSSPTGVWFYSPAHDKTQRFRSAGQKKVISIPIEAQPALSVYLQRLPADSTEYLFTPQNSIAEHTNRRRTAAGLPTNTTSKPRKVARYYTASAYRRAITRAAARANVPHWYPYQLRHTSATEIARVFGIEAAQTILGHRSPSTTLIYAERDQRKSAEIVKKAGKFLSIR